MKTPRTPSRSSPLDQWLEIAPWPIHHLDRRGLPANPNPALAALLGFTVDEMNRMTLRRCIPSQTRQRLSQVRQIISRSSTPYAELALSYHHRDGSKIEVRRARVGPLNASPQPVLVMLAELARPQTLDRAGIQSRFSRLVAHDFNNVFTIAQSYVDLARRQGTTTRLASDYLERAARAIRRGIGLNEHLQTIALHDHLPVEVSPLDEVLEIIRLYLPRLLSPGPKWSIVAQQNLAPVLSHPVLMTRFLIDLSINAQLRWPHATELSLQIRSAPSSQPSILVRITPPETTAAPLPMPFRLYLCRPSLSAPERTDPLFVHGIVERHPISVDCSDDAVIALIPAFIT